MPELLDPLRLQLERERQAWKVCEANSQFDDMKMTRMFTWISLYKIVHRCIMHVLARTSSASSCWWTLARTWTRRTSRSEAARTTTTTTAARRRRPPSTSACAVAWAPRRSCSRAHSIRAVSWCASWFWMRAPTRRPWTPMAFTHFTMPLFTAIATSLKLCANMFCCVFFDNQIMNEAKGN